MNSTLALVTLAAFGNASQLSANTFAIDAMYITQEDFLAFGESQQRFMEDAEETERYP